MKTPEVKVENITDNPDAVMETVAVVGSCIGFGQEFEDHDDFERKLKPTLVLSASIGETVVGGLIAQDFGKRLQTIMGDMRSAYQTPRWQQWQELIVPKPVSYFQERQRPPARFGLLVCNVGVTWSLQGNGIGRLLMNTAINFARARGDEEVKLVQIPESKGFYDKLGFESRTGFGHTTRRFSLKTED